MGFHLLLLLLGALFLSGCSGQPSGPKEVDRVKSCEALLYEREKTAEALAATPPATPESQRAKYALVGAGALLSFHPVLLSGQYFYLLPAVTAWYYNTSIRHDDRAALRERNQARLKTLETLIEERPCNP